MNTRRLLRLRPWLVAILAVIPAMLHAATPPQRPSAPNFDKRAAAAAAAVIRQPAVVAAEQALATRAPGVEIARDGVTGAPSWISSPNGFLTGPNGEGLAVPAGKTGAFAANDPDRVTKAFLAEHRDLFGHGPEALTAARKAPDDVTAHSGLRTSIWQQEVDGVAVFEALFKSHQTAVGELVNVGSGFVADPIAAAARGVGDRASALGQPKVSAAEAVRIAAAGIGDEVGGRGVAPQGKPEGVTRRQEFRTAALTGARAEYVWLPMDGQTLRLCWQLLFTSRARGELYRVLVDTQTGEPLIRHCLTNYISNASFRVYTSDSPTPFSPGHATPSTAQPPTVQRSLVTLRALDTFASPNGWIDDGITETRGNNVDAHTDADDNNQPDLPRPTNVGRIFDFPVNLGQEPSTYRNAAVTDLFYWNNLIHDRFYQLGFTETARNFQNNNFARGGVGNDAVQADAQDGANLNDGFHANNANFSTPPDGQPGRMQMYEFDSPTPARDGDFDHEIVIHEYTHGLSNRLVGGGVGIFRLQPAGMGEGWSDFYALCLLAQPGDDPNANYASGGYATFQFFGLPENYYFGIRRYPYSTNLTKNPLTFRDIATAQASQHAGIPRSPIFGPNPPADEVHNIGEVWCAALWEARANLIAAHGFAGNELILQIVTDGMKLAPANPNFIQARNAIIQADQVKSGGANFARLWAGFAKRGMGASATAPASTTNSTAGLVQTFNVPATVTVTVPASIAEGAAAGVGTLTASPAPVVNLNVTLANPSPGQLTLPATATILAGQTQTTFAISAVDDANLDGSPAVRVGATAAGYTGIPATVAVLDNETTTLSVTIPATAVEGATGVIGTVSAGANVAADVTMTLSSSDTTELQVATTVTIPSGQSSVNFPLTIVDDNLFDGTQSATLTAQVPAWTSGSGTISVTDNETTVLALILPATVGEGDDAVQGVISSSGAPSTDLVVTLTSNDPGLLSVPSTVTILAGDSSASFDIVVHDDTTIEPNASVAFSATAGGFTSAAANLSVVDDDPDHFTIESIPEQFANFPFRLVVRALNAANQPVLNFGGSITLSASSGSNTVPVTPTTFSGFVNGVLTTQATVTAPAQDVVLTVNDGGNHVGTSNAFDVIAGTPDFLTELFTPPTDANDTAGATYTFLPVASRSGYLACRTPASAFPTNPAGGTAIPLSDDDFVQVTLTGGAQVLFFGTSYSSFFIGSNGYITFGSGDFDLGEGIDAHFRLPRIAALFDDINPGAGGTVTRRQLADRFAVTWQGVPEFGVTNSNNFQIELFFDGRIRITILAIAVRDGLIGLSPGNGTPAGFIESNFRGYLSVPPTVTALDSETILEDTVLALPLTIGDDVTPAASLTLTALSSNTAVVPVENIVFGGTGADRTVQVTPAPNQSGDATITVRVRDADNRQTDVVFSVSVTAVNDPPLFTPGPPQNIAEDGAPQIITSWASGISAGPNEAAQSSAFLVSNDNPALFAAAPVIAADGTLSFTAAPNANGVAMVTVRLMDDGGTTNGGVDVSAPQTFAINVVSVNDVPGFVTGPDQMLLEDAGAQTVPGWATAISAGPANESPQGLVFLVSTDNPALFAIPPTVAPDGTLTYTPAPDAFGTAVVRIRLQDDGGTANGGIDTSAEQIFTIAVSGINEVPSFTKGIDPAVLEDAGPQTLAGWAAAVSAGPSNEAGQALDFLVVTDNTALFSALPAVAPNGTLTFTTAPNANGSATVTVRLHDGGGTANGGVDTSAPQTFTITVTALNDAPVFTAGADQTVVQNTPGKTLAGWGSGITPGPADEASQTVQFVVEVDDPALFATPPSISPDGTLTFTPAEVASGRATVTVRLQDDGGTANGGLDTSPPQSFVISILGGPQLTGRYNGLARTAPGRTAGHESVGLLGIKGTKKGTFTGSLVLGGRKFPFKGSVDPDGIAVFGKSATETLELKRRGTTSLFLNLRLLLQADGDRITGSVLEGVTDLSTLSADRAVYSKTNPVPLALRDPGTDKGKHTVVFLANPAPNGGLAADAFPQGDGYGRLSVSPKGVVKVSGELADGSPYSYSNTLSATNRWSFYVALYKKAGSCTGEALFRDVAGQSDLDGDGFQWFCPDRSSAAKPPSRYPLGWPGGILTDLLGSRFVSPDRGQSVLPGLGVPDADGNALFVATAGGLNAPPLSKALNIDGSNKVEVVLPAEDQLKLSMARSGIIKGTFADSFGLPKPSRAAFTGVVFQKQQQASGFFLGPTHAGAIQITPSN